MDFIYRYQVQGFEKMIYTKKIMTGMEDIVVINLYASTPEEAIERASKMVKKKFWRIGNISEEIDHSGVHASLIKTMRELGGNPPKPWEKKE